MLKVAKEQKQSQENVYLNNISPLRPILYRLKFRLCLLCKHQNKIDD